MIIYGALAISPTWVEIPSFVVNWPFGGSTCDFVRIKRNWQEAFLMA